MAALIEFLSQILEWLVEFLLWGFHTIYEYLLLGLAAIFDAIPVPSWLVGADPFASIDPGIAFFLHAFQIPAGIAIMLSAYLIRFLIRRVPVVG